MTDTNLTNNADCACFNLRRAARRITQFYDAALKPAGMQATQFSLLAMLQGIGRDGLRLGELADHLGMDRTTLTRNLKITDREGWTETRPGEDKRARLLFLTAAGEAALDRAQPFWREAQQNAATRLGDAGFGALLDLTRRLEPGQEAPQT